MVDSRRPGKSPPFGMGACFAISSVSAKHLECCQESGTQLCASKTAEVRLAAAWQEVRNFHRTFDSRDQLCEDTTFAALAVALSSCRGGCGLKGKEVLQT